MEEGCTVEVEKLLLVGFLDMIGKCLFFISQLHPWVDLKVMWPSMVTACEDSVTYMHKASYAFGVVSSI